MIAIVILSDFPKSVEKFCLIKLHPAETLEVKVTLDFGYLEPLLYE